MPYQPSLKIVHAFLDPETRQALPLPLVALITGALSQVETTIELTNRVCDSVFPVPARRRPTRRVVPTRSSDEDCPQ